MANITSISSNAMWQAQREVDSATQTAQLLQARARGARADAQQALETARSLESQASQAQSRATQASMTLLRFQSAAEVQPKTEVVYSKLTQIASLNTPTPQPSTMIAIETAARIESSVGTVIDTTA